MDGWIKFHRKSFDNFLYTENRPHTKREAWEDMLAYVNYEDEMCMIGNQNIECKRGQSLMSLESWGKIFNWEKWKVKDFFITLSKATQITTENLRKTTRLTILNYDYYQGDTYTKPPSKPTRNLRKTSPIKEEKKVIDESITKEEKNKRDFDLVFEKWLNYKKERRETYKSVASQLACYNKLVKYSSNDPVKANEIIENSMAGNYMGFFEPKEKTNGKPVVVNQSIGIPKDGW